MKVQKRQAGDKSNFFASLLVVASILFSVIVYLPTLNAGFFSDDYTYIVENRQLKELPVLDSWKAFSEKTNPVEYLPIRDLSYKADMTIFGLRPWGFHLSNILLYCLVCLSVWYFIRNLLQMIGYDRDRERDWALIAAYTTAIFALHPAHVESVAWISGRKELLSGLFAFLSMGLFASAEMGGSWRRGKLSLSYFCFALALLSKSTVITLPLFLLIAACVPFLTVLRDRSRIKSTAFAVLPFFIISLLSLILSLQVGGEYRIRLSPYEELTLGANPLNRALVLPLKILGFLTRISFTPLNLRLIYDVQVPGIVGWLALILGVVAVGGAVWGVIKLSSSKSLSAIGICVVVIFSLPFLQLIPFTTWSLASERFVFIPVFGSALIITAVIRKFRRGYTIILPLILLIFLSLSAYRSLQWQSPATLWSSNARYSPGNGKVIYRLVNKILLPEGRFDEALSFSKKVRQDDARTFLEEYVNTIKALREGKPGALKKAIELLEPSMGKDSRDVGGYLLLGKLYERNGKDYEAARYFYYAAAYWNKEAAVRLQAIRNRHSTQINDLMARISENPADIRSRSKLAGLYTKLFMLDEARQQYGKLLGLVTEPYMRAVVHYNLGVTAVRAMSYTESVREFRLAIDGGYKNSEVFNNLAISYRETGDFSSAEEFFLKAASVNSSYADSLFNLGLLRFQLGEKGGALKAFEEARARMVKNGKSTERVDRWIIKVQQNTSSH